MEKGQSHGLPPEWALRKKWMRMTAKCNMTDPTVSRCPRPIRMGRFHRKSGVSMLFPRFFMGCILPGRKNLEKGVHPTPEPGPHGRKKNEKGVHPTPEPGPPDSSGLQAQGELNVLPRRYMGVICKPIPATQEDGSEQGAAIRPGTCGDVPSPEDGGGNGHPKRGWHGKMDGPGRRD